MPMKCAISRIASEPAASVVSGHQFFLHKLKLLSHPGVEASELEFRSGSFGIALKSEQEPTSISETINGI